MKILIAEDSKKLSQAIKQCLEYKYSVQQAFDGNEAFYYAKDGIYDLIILDVMMPGMDGYTVIKKLRENQVQTPVLMLTALRGVEERIRGLRLGADDYLPKPFAKDELLLRIEAILRRSNNLYDARQISYKDLVINYDEHSVRINGKVLPLKGRQFDVLEYLVLRQGQLVSKSQVFDKVWGFLSDTSTNVVEVYVSALRKILKAHDYDKYLHTIRGAGYLFGERDHR